MTLEMVLNELSFQPLAADIPEARLRMSEFMATIRAATKSHISKVLRTQTNMGSEELASGYQLVQWRNDRAVDDVERLYFKSLATKAPYLVDINDPSVNAKIDNSDFFYNGHKALGLAVAYSLDTLAISFRSETCWYPHYIDLNYTYIDNDEEIIEETVAIVHASHKDHLPLHDAWIEKRLKSDIQDGADLWQQKDFLFPNLQFCDSVGQTLQSNKIDKMVLRTAIHKLHLLEKFCQKWQERGGAFIIADIPIKVNPDSDVTLSKYAQERTFHCPDGEKRRFKFHAYLTDSYRMYFYPIDEKQQLIVGYIGKHLHTVHFP